MVIFFDNEQKNRFTTHKNKEVHTSVVLSCLEILVTIISKNE